MSRLADSTDSKRISGLLPIRKESGVISKDIERSIIKKFGKFKIGHIGTLDPMASGVLALLFEDATKLQNYFDSKKIYSISIKLGICTSTHDITGKIISSSSDFSLVNEQKIKEVIKKYIGQILQIPPMYSAVKYKGKPLYKYARGKYNLDVDQSQFERKVSIYNIKIESIRLPTIDLNVECSQGTYMRSLAYDIGQDLGCGGCLSRIERLYSSGISLDECVGIQDVLESSSIDQVYQKYMIPLFDLKLKLPEMKVDTNFNDEGLFCGLKIFYSKERFYKDNAQKDGLFLFKIRDRFGLVEVNSNERDSSSLVIKLRRGIC